MMFECTSYDRGDLALGTIKMVRMVECPRCGGEHEDLEVMRMAQPMEVGIHVFVAWAWCPTMSDPIMLRKGKL